MLNLNKRDKMIKFFKQVEKVLGSIPIDFGGGCSVEKAYLMGALIIHYDLKISLDIGIYRGRSFFPQALAHKQFSGGIVYGVDPWSSEEAREYDNQELYKKIHEFIDKTDFEYLYKNVVSKHEELSLQDHSKIIRLRSDKAINFFKENNIYFDLIHIDGNHDIDIVNRDVELYLQRLSPKGFLVLDDISWDSVKYAYQRLSKEMKLIFQIQDQSNDYAVFCNRGSFLRFVIYLLSIRWLLWIKR